MCGIFGVINTKEKIDEGRVLAARDILAHRGPDDAGIYFSPCHPEPVEGSAIPSLACTEPVEVSSRARHNERVILSTSSRAETRDEGPFVALAHRRLSIIDLSPAAHQPMFSGKALSAISSVSPEGAGSIQSRSNRDVAEPPYPVSSIQDLPKGQAASRYVIVFNGEIFNFKDLISRLSSHVSRLTSNSDTEVILNLYAQYGKDCLSMLRGMFAFAIWDDKEKTLFAARDRFGIKPFYYLHNENEFIFSSELKAIKHYKKNLTISKEGIDAFLRTGSVPSPLTIYNEVASLLPGQYLIMHNAQCTMYNYWNFSDLFEEAAGQNAQSSMFNVKSAMNKIPTTSKLSIEHSKFNIKKSKSVYDTNAKKIIRTALLDSVRAHMVSDVEVGAFLSGGIDSTAIVSLMRQVGQEKIKTVSVVFPGNKLDESKYARLAAKTYNTEHIEVPFYEKDLLDDFENIMSVMDQPTIDGINTYFVSKAAKQAGLKVVLSGLGGDELFGGYPSFRNIPKYQKIKNLPFAKMFMKAAAPLLKNKLPAKAIEYFLHPDSENAEYKLVRGLFTDDELKRLGWNGKRQSSDVKSQKVTTNDPLTTNDSMTTNDPMTMNDSISNDPMTIIQDQVSDIQNQVSPKGASSIQYLTELQYVSMMETCHYMRNQLLRDSDIFSMAHSLELRVPFVDHLLYKSVLPYLDKAFDKNYPKKMLVDAVGDIPSELINRPKMGFTFPFADWIMNGQLKDKMFDSIKELNSDFNLYPFIFDLEKLHWSRLWALFILSRYV